MNSPLQNLGLFRDIRTNGTTQLPGVTPASTLDLTAIFLGTASDKTMPISTDTVTALNAIMGLPALSEADVATLAAKAETSAHQGSAARAMMPIRINRLFSPTRRPASGCRDTRSDEMTKWLVPLFAAGLIVAGSPAGMAADAGTADHQLAQGMGPGTGAGSDTRPYGWQIMTGQERAQFQERMRNAQTAEERARIRAENHERMQQRARERGIQLPDEPPSSRGPGSGQGGGQGGGAGQGMGRGGGMMDDDMRRGRGAGGGRR